VFRPMLAKLQDQLYASTARPEMVRYHTSCRLGRPVGDPDPQYCLQHRHLCSGAPPCPDVGTLPFLPPTQGVAASSSRKKPKDRTPRPYEELFTLKLDVLSPSFEDMDGDDKLLSEQDRPLTRFSRKKPSIVDVPGCFVTRIFG